MGIFDIFSKKKKQEKNRRENVLSFQKELASKGINEQEDVIDQLLQSIQEGNLLEIEHATRREARNMFDSDLGGLVRKENGGYVVYIPVDSDNPSNIFAWASKQVIHSILAEKHGCNEYVLNAGQKIVPS